MESISCSSESDGKVLSYRINCGLEFFSQRVLIGSTVEVNRDLEELHLKMVLAG